MEFWEKQYEKTILDEKKKKELQRKKYLNNCWNEIEKRNYKSNWKEIEKEDGTKWYIPKEKKLKFFRKRKKIYSLVKNRYKKATKFCLVIFSFFTMLLLGIYAVKTFDFSQIINLTGKNQLSRTYVDGLGFAEMMSELKEIENKHNEKIKTYVLGDFSFQNKEIDLWLNDIDNDLVNLENMVYDDSYSKVISNEMASLKALKNFILCVENGRLEEAQEFYDIYNACLKDIKELLVETLEENGINYTYENGVLNFQYHMY